MKIGKVKSKLIDKKLNPFTNKRTFIYQTLSCGSFFYFLKDGTRKLITKLEYFKLWQK